MVLSSFFISILLKLIITVVFTLMNALLIREIIVYFRSSDDTFGTSTALAFWIGAIFLVSSFLADLRYLGWVIAIVANLFFIFLYKHYSGKFWEEAILMWETWISVMLYAAMFLAALSQQLWILILWGALPLAINLSYIVVLKYNLQKKWVNIPTTFFGFLGMNVVMLLFMQAVFPI